MKLSVVIPVYNERYTINEIIEQVKAVEIEKEIIIVDDFSTDGTRQILKSGYGVLGSGDGVEDKDIKVIFHEKNVGKGVAIRTGLKYVTGDCVVIQDSDLEYDPRDYHKLIQPILEGRAEVVYGSRFKGDCRNMSFWHWMGNKFLTLITNILYNARLSDMETCYKLFKTGIIKGINLESERFEFEPEVSAKLLKKGIRICEIPISYFGREFSHGKKINWRDGFSALRALIEYRFFD